MTNAQAWWIVVALVVLAVVAVLRLVLNRS
jgi:hypothetical protein